MRLKAKVYQTVVQPVMIYEAQCWALNKRWEKTKGNRDAYAEEDAWGDKEGQTEEQGGEGENRSPGEYYESSGEKVNGWLSDGEKKEKGSQGDGGMGWKQGWRSRVWDERMHWTEKDEGA